MSNGSFFKSPRVGCFLNGFGGHGETEDKELKLTLQVNPISPDLAAEISPDLRDALFYMDAGEWQRRAATKASFGSINIPLQNLRVFELPFGGGWQSDLIPSASIGNLRADKNEAGEYRLTFDVVIPMDRHTMQMVHRLFKASCFITTEEVQVEIPGGDQVALQTGLSLQDAADGDDAVVDPEAQPRTKKKKGALGRLTVTVTA